MCVLTPDCAPLAAGWELCGRDMTHHTSSRPRAPALVCGCGDGGGRAEKARQHCTICTIVLWRALHNTTHWLCKHHSLSQYTSLESIINILGHKDVLPRIFPLAIPGVIVICLSAKEN